MLNVNELEQTLNKVYVCMYLHIFIDRFLYNYTCAHTMCSRVLLSLRDPTIPTTDTVNITRPSRMSTTAGARKRPSRVRFFCLSTSAYTPTHSTQRPISWGETERKRVYEMKTLTTFSMRKAVSSLLNYVACHVFWDEMCVKTVSNISESLLPKSLKRCLTLKSMSIIH